MTAKKIGDVTVNDGKGLFDNEGLCETLIADLNNLQKLLFSGQFIQFSATITGMAQKLINLKNGIKTEKDSLQNNIEELKRMNDILIKRDGADNGEN